MQLDNELVLASAWSPTATGNNYSTNVLDLGPLASGMPITPYAQLNRNIGAGEALWLEVLITASVTSGGAASVEFRLETDDNSGFSSGTLLFSFGAIAKATLVAGYKLRSPLPSGINTPYERYIAVNAAITTNNLTGGTFRVHIVKSVQDNTMYVPGFKLDS